MQGCTALTELRDPLFPTGSELVREKIRFARLPACVVFFLVGLPAYYIKYVHKYIHSSSCQQHQQYSSLGKCGAGLLKQSLNLWYTLLESLAWVCHFIVR